MNKSEWISNKIGILIREGRPQAEAAAIAYSMYERGDHMQEGGLPTAQFGGIQYLNGQDLYGNMAKNVNQPTTSYPNYTNMSEQNRFAPQLNLDTSVVPPNPTLQKTQYGDFAAKMEGQYPTPIADLSGKPFQADPNLTRQLGVPDMKTDVARTATYMGNQTGANNLGGAAAGSGVIPTEGTQEGQSQDWVKYNILNPYKGDMDLSTSLAYTGQQFGQGKTGMGVMGAGLSLLKGARSFLSGYGAGKGQQNVEKSYHENQFNRDEDLYRRTENYQQGGQLPFAQEAIVPEDLVNIQAQTQSPEWLTSGAQPIVPGQAAQDPNIVPVPTPAQAATPTNVDEGKGFDKNSARDTWAKKTGLPWSEAKRLGYTDGSAKDNTKLLGELNDPRFSKDKLRSAPFTAPVATAKAAAAATSTPAPTTSNFQNLASPSLRKAEDEMMSKYRYSSASSAEDLAFRAKQERAKAQQKLESVRGRDKANETIDWHGIFGGFEPYFKQEGGIMQQGGLTQADLLTGNYMTGEGQQNPNVEVEGGEHTKNSQTGQVQEVVGDKHVDGGEKVELPNKSKVLSDYTKIGASNANIFSEMFDIKVKAGDTFATVLDKYNSKIGVKTLEKEEKELLEKLEKNTKTSMDKSTKQINEDFLAQEIAEINKKKEATNKLKAQAFESIFEKQELVPKKGDGTQILNKAGNPIKQMGGYKEDDDYYQEGGQPQGGVDPQQVAQALQGGADPNQVVQQLVQAGVSQEEAVGMVQQIVQQLQGAQPQMRDGGMYEDLTYHQTKPVVEEKPYTFQTQYTPTVEGYDVKGTSVLNQPMLSDVEYMQHRTGKGYGQKMADVEKTIGTHGWYFDTEAKKKAFREAIVKPDAGGVVKDFQNAYNQEATKRGKAAGLNDEQISKLITDVGFTGTGVQQFDDKFGAFTSTRPLFDFSKVEPKPTPPTEPTPEAGTVPRDVVKNIVSTEGMPYVMPPSAPIAPYLQQVDLSRLESRKGSVENQLQASENARQAAYEATKGLPPAQAAAMMANYLSTSGQQDVQGIANQEIADTTDRVRTEQYNAGQLDKEKLLNEQLKKQYEREAFGTLNVNEQNWRNYYDANEANRQALSDKIERRNIMNLGLTNYQLDGQGGFEFVNKSPFSQVAQDPKLKAMWDAMTPEERMVYEKAYAAKQATTPTTGNVVDLTKYKK